LLILGTAWPNWIDTLSDNSLWAEISDVREVRFARRVPPTDLDESVQILPLLEEDIEKCYLDGFAHRALLPSKKTLGICADKKTFHKFAVDNGFESRVPKIYSPFLTRIQFPVILKPTKKNASAAISICDNFLQLIMHVKIKIGLREFLLGRGLIQEYIKGEREYNFYSVCVDGEIKWSYTRSRRLITDAFFKPSSTYADDQEAVLTTESMETLTSILRALHFNGPSCIDFTLINKIPVIFEINPRLGGGLLNAPHLRPQLVECLRSIFLARK
jgi:carbamoylphosphate synthase large subunit